MERSPQRKLSAVKRISFWQHGATFSGAGLHYGIFIALVSVAIFYFVLKFTRWGFEMRAIGGNWEAARR